MARTNLTSAAMRYKPLWLGKLSEEEFRALLIAKSKIECKVTKIISNCERESSSKAKKCNHHEDDCTHIFHNGFVMWMLLCLLAVFDRLCEIYRTSTTLTFLHLLFESIWCCTFEYRCWCYCYCHNCLSRAISAHNGNKVNEIFSISVNRCTQMQFYIDF